MKAIIGMVTCPVSLLVKIWFDEQYSRPTPGRIRYLALKPSILAGESTNLSSLPIPLILGDAKMIYLRNNAGKGNGKRSAHLRVRNLQEIFKGTIAKALTL